MGKIKIYISDTFFTLEQHLINHLNSIDHNSGLSLFISSCSGRLNSDVLAVTQALIIPYEHNQTHYEKIIIKLCNMIYEKKFQISKYIFQ